MKFGFGQLGDLREDVAGAVSSVRPRIAIRWRRLGARAPAVLLNIYLSVYCRLNPELRIVSRITHETNLEAVHRARVLPDKGELLVVGTHEQRQGFTKAFG